MKTIITVCIFIMGLVFAVNGFAADVAQGECIQYDTENKLIKIQEYDTNFSENKYGNPTSIETEFDVSQAKIGMTPSPGDILRIAYQLDGNRKMAVKVMNVTKQDLMKK